MSALPGILMTGNGTSAITKISPASVLNANFQAAPAFSCGLIATVSSGATLTYTVQVTADPIPSASGNWNSHDVLVSLTASTNSNCGYPITGVRLVVTGWASGTVNLGIALWP